MSTFFDTDVQADLDLLHSSVRDHAELDNVASQVEWEIIDHFSQRPYKLRSNYDAFFEYESGSDESQEIEVRLIGYNSTTPASSEAGLKEALRRTIGKVVSEVLRDYDNANDVQSITQGKRSITYAGKVPTWDEWPDNWKGYLSNYSARIPNYAT